MTEVLVPIVFVVIGLVLLFNVRGAAEAAAGHGRRQADRWGRWLAAGSLKSALAIRLLGLGFIVISIGITLFPPG